MVPSIEERIRPIWRKWNGVIPVWEAERAGIRPDSFRRWALRNPDATHPRKGVYMWYPDVPDGEEPDWEYAPVSAELAWAGPDAWLCGPSTLETARIGSVGGIRTSIAVPKRRRHEPGIIWRVTTGRPTTTIAGLPSESIPDALRSSIGLLDSDKMIEAVRDAWAKGLIDESERRELEAAV